MHTAQKVAVAAKLHERFSSSMSNLAVLLGNVDANSMVERFVSSFDSLPALAGYKYTPVSTYQLQANVQQRISPQHTYTFLYACILSAIGRTLDSGAFEALPPRVKGHQLKQFSRIASAPNTVIPTYTIDSDLFHKDMGLALLRLYAAAAQLVDYRAGVGRRILTTGGIKDIPRRLATFARIGGFKPFFEIHTHLSYLDEFNQEGWNECYRCCAELYGLHPDVLGMYGGSWFYDPALAKISPRLSYLREIPQKGGACLLFDSINEQSTHDATSTSPTRQQLYAEGAYHPKSYALIWPRTEQVNWAKTNQIVGYPTDL